MSPGVVDPENDHRGLPWTCYGAHPTTGELILIKRDTMGYWPCEDYSKGPFPTWSEAADALNERRGVTKAQRAAMESGSVFGWDTAAADPTRYDEQGQFRRTGT